MATTNLDPSRLMDGNTSFEGGVNAGISPRLISPNQFASSGNASCRGGLISTRPPWFKQTLTFQNDTVQARFTGRFQGACSYISEFSQPSFIVSRGGKLFRIEIKNNWLVTEITPKLTIVTTAEFTVPTPADQVTVNVNSQKPFTIGETVFIDSGEYTVDNIFAGQLYLTYVGSAANPTVATGASVLDVDGAVVFEYESADPNADFIHLFQAENYVIILRDPYKTVIFDGSRARLALINEVPVAVMGAYGMGRIWVVLHDRTTFRAGDLVFGPSGTPENGYRDAILKFTENSFLNEGGDFSVTVFGSPYEGGKINSIQFVATQDTSLGLGALIMGTANLVASVDAPIDRTTWKNLRYPIKTISLIDYGPVGPRNSIQVNSDIWFRSLDGMRSFIIARRNFGTWGNTPLSNEVRPFLEVDSPELLFFGSSILFDNRLLCTISPYNNSNAVLHKGIVDINYDLLSQLQTKASPAWEGIWTGLDICQLIKASDNGVERGFIMAFEGDEFQIWEIGKKTGSDTRDVDGTITPNAIEAWIDTKSYSFGDSFQKKQLYMMEIYLENVMEDCELRVKFRPDQFPNWTDWQTEPICVKVAQCSPPFPETACEVWTPNNPGYAARLRLPQPSGPCNEFTQTPINNGFEFQIRIEWTGSLTIGRIRVHAKLRQQETQGECAPESVECKVIKGCNTNLFSYNANGS